MEVAREFIASRELMASALGHLLEGHLTPPTLFTNIIAEKCRLVNHHFSNTRDHLRIAANVSHTAATIDFYDNSIADPKFQTVTITNTMDLENQLVQLWREVQRVLHYYHEDDQISEKASIESYYRNFAYKQRLVQLFPFEF